MQIKTMWNYYLLSTRMAKITKQKHFVDKAVQSHSSFKQNVVGNSLVVQRDSALLPPRA